MHFDWLTLLGIFCIGQCLFLASIYLFANNEKTLTSYLLIGLLLIFTYDLIHDLLVYTRWMLTYPQLTGWASLFTYLKGPMIFFLVKSMLDFQFKLKWIDGLHLVVFLYQTIGLINFEIGHDLTWKLNFLNEYYHSIDHSLPLPANASLSWNDLWLLHPILYVLYALYLSFTNNHKEPVKETRKNWLKFFMLGYALVYMLNITLYVLSTYFESVSQMYWGYSSLQFSVLIIALSYANLNLRTFKVAVPYMNNTKSNALSKEQSSKIIDELDTLVWNEKTFLVKRLSINDLSKMTHYTSHQLSQAINENKHVNFQDYINQFRVKHSQQLMGSNFHEEYTFEALASETGFNSNTSFYRAFKKLTGMTPKQYLEKGK